MSTIALGLHDSCPTCGSPIFSTEKGEIRSCRCVAVQHLAATQRHELEKYDKHLEGEIAEMLKALENLLAEHYQQKDLEGVFYLDSMAKPCATKAIEILAKHEKVKISGKAGRRILAHWN